jgi:hypothetical protein
MGLCPYAWLVWGTPELGINNPVTLNECARVNFACQYNCSLSPDYIHGGSYHLD